MISANFRRMAPTSRTARKRTTRSGTARKKKANSLKKNTLRGRWGGRARAKPIVDPEVQRQLKQYEDAVRYMQQQKFHRAKELLEKVAAGPSKELAERGRVHLRICEQRVARPPAPVLRTADDHYHHGVAMMNLGRWDEAREHLDRARKAAPKADYVIYALAALACLTGETDAAMENLKQAIALRPENRYHARNDEDFVYLQEDPRFTELLYPER